MLAFDLLGANGGHVYKGVTDALGSRAFVGGFSAGHELTVTIARIDGGFKEIVRFSEFICDNGCHLLRCGGPLPWWLNNAGDLMSPRATHPLGSPAKATPTQPPCP